MVVCVAGEMSGGMGWVAGGPMMRSNKLWWSEGVMLVVGLGGWVTEGAEWAMEGGLGWVAGGPTMMSSEQ